MPKQIVARNEEYRLIHMQVGINPQKVWHLQRRRGDAWNGGTEVYRAEWRALKAAREIGLDLGDESTHT